MSFVNLVVSAATQEQTEVPFTQEEIDAVMAAREAEPNPDDYQLTMTDLRLGIIAAGFSIEEIEQRFRDIEDRVVRETVWVWWTTSQMIAWNHQYTQQLLVLAGFTQEQAYDMWVARIQAIRSGA